MKTYSTARLMRILERRLGSADLDEALQFVAKDTESSYEQRATIYNTYVAFEERAADGAWVEDSRPTYRTDWIRTNQKPKSKPVPVGYISLNANGCVTSTAVSATGLEHGEYTLMAVKK